MCGNLWEIKTEEIKIMREHGKMIKMWEKIIFRGKINEWSEKMLIWVKVIRIRITRDFNAGEMLLTFLEKSGSKNARKNV